ncbi:hypothetical protein TNCV_4152071 [Trichonephila clavipes]|nr:hypothetical protein TNCV_4152071 [Trichonephila clavipes]
MSARTIRQRLQQYGLSARRPCQRLLLMLHHRQKRLQWCNQQRTSTHECSSLRGAIGYMSRSSRVRIDGSLNTARYISENVWPTVAERLAHQHTAVTTVDELWHRVEAAWASTCECHPISV